MQKLRASRIAGPSHLRLSSTDTGSGPPRASLLRRVLGFALGNLRGRNAERQRASRVAAEQAEATADGGD